MGYYTALRMPHKTGWENNKTTGTETTKTMMLALKPIELRDDKVQWNLTRFWRAAWYLVANGSEIFSCIWSNILLSYWGFKVLFECSFFFLTNPLFSLGEGRENLRTLYFLANYQVAWSSSYFVTLDSCHVTKYKMTSGYIQGILFSACRVCLVNATFLPMNF